MTKKLSTVVSKAIKQDLRKGVAALHNVIAESKLVQFNFKNNSYSVYSITFNNLCIQYAKPWPHSDIRFCCCQLYMYLFMQALSAMILLHLATSFVTPKVFLHEILFTRIEAS